MKKLFAIVVMLSLAILPFSSAWAVGSGGLENASFSAKQLGSGGAVTATPDEPAAISYNPAGIVDLPGIQFQSNANFISLMTLRTMIRPAQPEAPALSHSFLRVISPLIPEESFVIGSPLVSGVIPPSGS